MPYSVKNQSIQPNSAAFNKWAELAMWLMTPAASAAKPDYGTPKPLNPADYEPNDVIPDYESKPVSPPSEFSEFDYTSWFTKQPEVQGGGYNVNLPPKKEPNSY